MPLSRFHAAQQRFGGRADAIDRWLDQRQALLVHYLKLTGAPHPDTALPSREAISAFCDALVDYVSAGHFEIYEQLLEQAEHSDAETLRNYRALLPGVAESTDAALNFNDRYGDSDEKLETFDGDLATLGAALSDRFDMEDRMLALFLPSHEAA